MSKQKWAIHKWRCRQNYRDGCRPVWMATPPDSDGFSFEFPTWAKAVEFVCSKESWGDPQAQQLNEPPEEKP